MAPLVTGTLSTRPLALPRPTGCMINRRQLTSNLRGLVGELDGFDSMAVVRVGSVEQSNADARVEDQRCHSLRSLSTSIGL